MNVWRLVVLVIINQTECFYFSYEFCFVWGNADNACGLICFCISVTFNNPLKVYFSSKKYLTTIQTRPTQIVLSIFLIEKTVFNRFLKIIGVQNQLPIPFCSDLLCNKTLMVRNSTPTHTNF